MSSQISIVLFTAKNISMWGNPILNNMEKIDAYMFLSKDDPTK